jgi:hypothetical protein
MKKFLAVYTGDAAGAKRADWAALSEAQRAEQQRAGIAAWHQWVEKNKNAIVDIGSPLGHTKCASPQGVADSKNNLTAYTVVQAESHEVAAKLFEGHPHFMIFPGDSIEIMECLPIPTR